MFWFFFFYIRLKIKRTNDPGVIVGTNTMLVVSSGSHYKGSALTWIYKWVYPPDLGLSWTSGTTGHAAGPY